MRWRTHDEAVGWIAYTDFLTVLTVLFFTVVLLDRVHGPARIAGRVLDESDAGVMGCLARINNDSSQTVLQRRTDKEGLFDFRFDGVRLPEERSLSVDCRPVLNWAADTTVTLVPGRIVPVEFRRGGNIRIASVSGSSLFETDRYQITHAGVLELRRLAAERLRPVLETDGRAVIAVMGHTDPRPFPSPWHNWGLSAARAAEVVHVLTHPRFGIDLDRCRVVAMAFEATAPESSDDSYSSRRRVEFRALYGRDLSGAQRGGCQ